MVTVAKFQGGGAFNVIPDSVTIGGTFRAFSKESLTQLKQRIEEVYKLDMLNHFANHRAIFKVCKNKIQYSSPALNEKPCEQLKVLEEVHILLLPRFPAF